MYVLGPEVNPRCYSLTKMSPIPALFDSVLFGKFNAAGGNRSTERSIVAFSAKRGNSAQGKIQHALPYRLPVLRELATVCVDSKRMM